MGINSSKLFITLYRKITEAAGLLIDNLIEVYNHFKLANYDSNISLILIDHLHDLYNLLSSLKKHKSGQKHDYKY